MKVCIQLVPSNAGLHLPLQLEATNTTATYTDYTACAVCHLDAPIM